MTSSNQLLHIKDLPNPIDTWIWLIMPSGEASRKSNTQAQVSAWHLNPTEGSHS